jgi:hypothetical protein
MGEDIKEEGAPSVRNGAAKCGRVGCHLSTHPHMSNKSQQERRVSHLLRVWAATSRVHHLSKRGTPPKSYVPISKKISTRSNANQVILSPFDSFLTFSFNLSSTLSPYIFLFFDLADFY